MRTFHADLGFLGGSDCKESAWNAGDPRFDPWVGKIPWKRAWQPTAVFLPGKSHGQRSLVGYTVHEVARVGHDLATKPPLPPPGPTLGTESVPP